MADFTGGYTSAVNDSTQRRVREQAIQESLARTAWDNWQTQQAQQNAKLSEEAGVNAIRAMPGMAPPEGPQTPPPGQASQPAPQPPPPQPPGMGGGPAATAGQFGPPPQAMGNAPNALGNAPMPQAGPPGAMPQGAPPGMPPAPAGWKPSPAASPALGGGGQPPAPPQGAGPAPGGAMPPMPPGGAPGAQPQPQPQAQQAQQPPQQQGKLPPQWLSVPKAIEAMQTMGLPIEKQYRTLDKMMPLIHAQNEQALAELKAETEATRAGAAAYAARKSMILAENAGLKANADTPKIKEAKFAAGGDEAEAQKLLKQDLQRKARVGGGGGAGGAGAGGYGQAFEKLNPRQQAAVEWYATQQIGGDGTWRTGLSRVKGGAELIKAVDEYVPVKAQELGLSAADVGTNRARRVASQAALTQNTKDIAAIKPFAQMLDQNAEILKGLAAKITKTDSALLNKPINYLQTHVGSNPDVAEFLAQMRLVQTEAARVITNPRLVGQLTDTARGELDEIINGNMALGSTNRVLDRLTNDSHRRISLMEGQQKSLEGGIKGMMEKPEGGGASEPAPTNGKGWKLMTDKNGNKAYVSPDKKQFEEVK